MFESPIVAPGTFLLPEEALRLPAAPAVSGIQGPHLVTPARNRLLGALPEEELARLRPYLEPIVLEHRAVLFDADTPTSHVYFPETAVISLVSAMHDGNTAEVGTAGCEGMAGLSVFLASEWSFVRAVAQLGGAAWRMSAASFAQLSATPGALHRLLLRYTQAFLTQVAQTAACNGAHLLEQRCARWLLMTHDRVDGDAFPLTHEFLALMLGVRRAGVSVAMRTLQDAGLIDYGRGEMRIVDRAGLERRTCECYDVVRRHFDALLPQGTGT